MNNKTKTEMRIRLSRRAGGGKSVADALKEHQKRTGVNPSALLRDRKDVPVGLSSGMIRNWMCGGTQSARRDHVDYVLKLWAAHGDDERVRITDAMRCELMTHMKRAGIGPETMLRGRKDMPGGLKISMPHNWLQPHYKFVRRDHWEYVLALYAKTPTIVRAKLTPRILSRLRAEQKRTGVGPSKLLRGGRAAMPDGLNAGIIGAWMSGQLKSARKEQLDYVLSLWADLEDDPRIRLTSAMRRQLKAHAKRTGIGAGSVLRERTDVPEGLRASVVLSWSSKNLKHVRKEYWDYVLRVYEDTPSKKDIFVTLTPRVLARIRAAQQRTGAGPTFLLKGLSDVPPGLTVQVVTGWLDGRTQTASRVHFDYAVARWASLPDASGMFPRASPTQNARILRSGRVPISPEFLDELRAYKDRTGIGPIALFSSLENKPGDLNGYMAQHWLGGQTKSAKPEHLDFVLNAYKQVPDKKPRQ